MWDLKFEISNLKSVAEHCEYCIGDFVGANRFHAAKIDWALAKKTGAALDVVPQDNVAVAERSGQARFRRSKDGDDRDAEQRREMHRAGIVREE